MKQLTLLPKAPLAGANTAAWESMRQEQPIPARSAIDRWIKARTKAQWDEDWTASPNGKGLRQWLLKLTDEVTCTLHGLDMYRIHSVDTTTHW